METEVETRVVGSATPPPSTPPAPKRKGWVWLAFWVIVLAAGWHYRDGLLAWWNQKPAASAAAATPAGRGGRGGRSTAAVPVVLARAVKGSIPIYLRGIGTVAAAYTVTVKTRVNGPIVKVDFQEGQFVHEGDVLAEIDPRPYQVALDQAVGQLAKDTALANDAKIDAARYQALYDQQIIAKQQLDTQMATVNEYNGAIASDQAAIDSAKLNLTFTKITAPISGRIGLRLVDPGNVVQTSDTTGLAVITQVQPIAVLFSLPQDELPQVYSKLRAGEQLQATALDSSDTKVIATGRLLTIDNQIDPTTGTYKLKAMFDNTDNALFPNQFVNIRLRDGEQDGLTIVPPAAIQRGPQGTYVFAVAPGKGKGSPTVTIRDVTVALTEGSQTGISSGLEPGSEVVVDGADKLEEGTRISVSRYDDGSPGGGASAAPATAVGDPAAAAASPAAPAAHHSGNAGKSGRSGRRGNRGGSSPR